MPAAEVRPLADLVRNAMQNAFPLDVPLRAEVKSGHNWWDVTPVGDDDGEEAGGLVANTITDGLFAEEE